jgi:hypothetical protein
MPKGTKKADVLPPFSTRLRELRAQAALQAAAFTGSGFRPWNIPEDTTATNLFSDIENLHGGQDTGFDRTTINKTYEKCFQDPNDPGTNGDVIGLKLQMDYLAAAERAFRFRHASTPRLLVHALSRRHFQGVGPVFPFCEEAVSNVIRSGALE